MGQITDEGFKVKSQNEYFEDERRLYLDIDPNWNLDPSTPDGLKIAHDAEIFGALEQVVKQAYDARDPAKAVGRDLDVLRALTGSVRSQGSPSTVTLFVTGEPSTIIPAGSRVKTSADVVFAFDDDVTIGVDGVGSGVASCTEKGAVEVSVGTLTNIVDVVAGWQTVENRTVAVLGTDADSDPVFRLKSAKAVASSSVGIVDSLYASILAVEGVRYCTIYENRQNNASVTAGNPHGLPAHSLAIVVDGGTDEDIAEAIFNKLSVGATLVSVGTRVDRTVYSKRYKSSYSVITFSRPLYKNITVSVKVADPSRNAPSAETLKKEIGDAVISYIRGTLIGSGIGFNSVGFDIGETVPFTRMFTPINKVLGNYAGTYVEELKLNGAMSNVVINYNELAQIVHEGVSVEVV